MRSMRRASTLAVPQRYGAAGLALLMAGVILMAVPHGVDAAVYKWVDEKGKVHYGERPPAGASKQQVKVRTRPAASPSGSAPSTAERLQKQRKLLKAYEADRAEKREQQAELAKKKAQLQAHCSKMQKYIQQESTAKYLYRKDKDGNKVPVPDQERKTHIAKIQKQYARHC